MLQPPQTLSYGAGCPLSTAAALWPWESPIPCSAHSPQPGQCPGEVTSPSVSLRWGRGPC